MLNYISNSNFLLFQPKGEAQLLMTYYDAVIRHAKLLPAPEISNLLCFPLVLNISCKKLTFGLQKMEQLMLMRPDVQF